MNDIKILIKIYQEFKRNHGRAPTLAEVCIILKAKKIPYVNIDEVRKALQRIREADDLGSLDDLL